MRWSRALVLIAILALLAACGGGGTTQSEPAEASGGDGGGGTTQSEPAEASAAPPSDDDDGDGGGGNGNADDAEAAFERLIPPNADEVSKATTSGMVFAGFTTPDSADSLTSFYEDAFNDLGLQILTTTEAGGGITWFVGTDEDASEFGGVVSVIPNTDGGSGSTVSIQIGATNQ